MILVHSKIVAYDQNTPLTIQVDAFAGNATLRFAVLQDKMADTILNTPSLLDKKQQYKVDQKAYKKLVDHFGVSDDPRIIYVDFNIGSKPYMAKDGHFILEKAKSGWYVVPLKANTLSIHDVEGALNYGRPT